ncbi:hypothetical protein BDA99DRAFT_492279 [Phascolomyces articulosus]|uniref:Disease resistance R13L4/SHOC-2-like LRR domain-containing protein n=1 Tax=Phascolomyces articulosus TaxID=60185 RepID=A0AAD5PJ93_9FUNG|nr:hypothetical protein BDA99DRAFT_492279 [Phascolomyces articulosus]
MGQLGSKLDEPLAFTGNNVLNTVTFHVNGRPQEKEWHDTVLDNPDLYHLEQDNKLAQDLAYIDQTYYKEEQEREDDDNSKTPARRDSAVISISTTGSSSQGQSEEVVQAEGLQEVIVDQRTMPSVAMDLTGRNLVRLGAGIGSLTSLTQLNLSHNQIRILPKELGNLIHLRVLNLSYNRIISLPDTIGRLGRLRAFNASYNQLDTLPVSMSHLDELMVLIVNNNAIKQLPPELKQLKRLATFHIAHNPSLTSVPAEVADMPSIKKWVANGCGFPETIPLTLPHHPPSLVEICARLLVKITVDKTTKRRKTSNSNYHHSRQSMIERTPSRFWSYLATVKPCSVCNGPYFDASCIHHHRIVDRSGTWMAIDYRLCSLHWSTEQDRLLYTFGYRRHIMQEGAVDAYAMEMQQKLYSMNQQHQKQSSTMSSQKENEDIRDGYYYCRLVPSNPESLDSSITQPTQIPGQKGGNTSGPSSLHLFATRYL